jgi:hypothetical protein
MIVSIDMPQLKQIVAEYMAFRTGVDPRQITVKFEVKEHKINTKISVPDKHL